MKIILIFFSFFSYAQVYKVVYDVNFITDSISKELKNEQMNLYIAKDTTVYISAKKINFKEYLDKIDQQGATEFTENNSLNINKIVEKYPSPIINHFIVKNENTYQIFSKISRNLYLIEQPIDEIAWKYENEKKQLLGYHVKKATTYYLGRKWEAWYTEEIPTSSGPYKFHGLPGLILEIYDQNHTYHFLSTEVYQTPNLPILKKDYSKSKKINLAEFKKIYQNRDNELIQSFKNLNIKSSNISQTEIEKRIEKRIQNENVFLEKLDNLNF